MHLDFTPEQKELRAEIRASLETVMTPERIAAVAGRMEGGDAVKECVRALGEAHLLGVGWPKEYGGRGFSALEQFIFFEEAQRVNAPIPLVTLNTVGPTLAACGTEEQKQTFLPAILEAPSSSRSVTPSPLRAAIWRRCAPPLCATATTTSSTARRCSPAAPDTPTTSG